MSKFQIIILGIFVLFIAAGILIFATLKGGQNKKIPSVSMWGTLPSNQVRPFIDAVVKKTGTKFKVTYVQQNPATMYQFFVESVVNGTGPDILLLNNENILTYQSKLFPIPYANYAINDYRSTFIPEGELYLSAAGVLALPFSVDPMVMYWNRDIYTNALVANPPQYWDEFVSLIPKMTIKNGSSAISQSAIGMGEYSNVTHAKDLLSLVMLQSGTPITSVTPTGVKNAIISPDEDAEHSAANKALTFYTQFADPTNNLYSWNRSLVDSKTLFTGNKLAVYFGYASELTDLRDKNPNLNFDVSFIPQIRATGNARQGRVTFGKLYGLALAKNSPNLAEASLVIETFTDASNLILWNQITNLPSVRRDSLNPDPSDPAASVLTQSALLSRGWIDLNADKTSTIFQNMIEGITSGRYNPSDALNLGYSQLQNLSQVQ